MYEIILNENTTCNDEVTETFANNDILGILTEIDLKIKEMMERREGKWHCKVCGRASKLKEIMRDHAETHIEGVAHQCNT